MKREDVVKAINNLKGEAGHKWVVEIYNKIKPLPRGYVLQDDDWWCASTVSAILHSLGYDDIAECSCLKMQRLAKDKGIWIEADNYVPKPADIVLYDWQDKGKGDNVGEPDHIGFVIKSGDGKFTVREGNKNNSVGNRTMDVDGQFIRGFIVPPYEDDLGDNETEIINTTPVEEKPKEKPANELKTPYTVGQTYTIKVRSALNVRKGAGKTFGLVGYHNLTPDAKKHSMGGSALLNGTRVTVQEVKVISETNVWVRIPSGWICAIDGAKKYVV